MDFFSWLYLFGLFVGWCFAGVALLMLCETHWPRAMDRVIGPSMISGLTAIALWPWAVLVVLTFAWRDRAMND